MFKKLFTHIENSDLFIEDLPIWKVTDPVLTKTLGTMLTVIIVSLLAFIIVPVLSVITLLRLIYLPYEKYGNKKIKKLVDKHLTAYGDKLIKEKGIYYIDTPHHYLNLQYFIQMFVTIHNIESDTTDSTGNVVCDKNKRRSLGDIFLICKSQFPGCTIQQVLKALLKLVGGKTICTCFCHTINKVVFYPPSVSPNSTLSSNVEYFTSPNGSYCFELHLMTLKELSKHLN